ncbi:YpdA family putative bacillithiol disulfide reductase [Gillisia limnaea]|uniref:FAD-dependent pyridine nucleotide-disulfide oxidoreductase n=1 Tax=Gillisia limnaea (strain DSM 15749 / LMG 21470 / R-8282) TaxID=865937 RepID=H2BXD1_GILLR|nr:YpdA family putative bacillithiol disulfide reductase [Gillisia limnaea]EHQ02013.1 FAD-dependent pyridine nucleotide-disulfide oxidoreductase [Gillisia limnaea DSM 15749]
MQIPNKTYDIIIIGSGPIGIACGLEAKKHNLSYLILEKGCLVNSLYHYPSNMTFFSTSEKLELDNIPFISINPKPRKAEALEYYRRIAVSNDLNINLFEKVLSIESEDETVHSIKTSKGIYTSKKVIIATGFYDIPNYLGIPGEDLPKVNHYYNDPHFYAKQKTIVVGASNSAVDAALEIYRKGGDVTMIVRTPEIGQRVKYWVRPDIINRIEEGSIKAYFEAEIAEIKETSVILKTPEGEKILENDFVLLLTGYRPNFGFLKNIGINISQDEKHIPEYGKESMETNVSGVYLAGVICGGMETHKWFIENSRIHAQMILQDIDKKIKKAS